MERQTQYRKPCMTNLPLTERSHAGVIAAINDEIYGDTSFWYRKPGPLKGRIIMSDDFDAPLDDFEDYM